jgi:hypothetical protein
LLDQRQEHLLQYLRCLEVLNSLGIAHFEYNTFQALQISPMQMQIAGYLANFQGHETFPG